MNTIQVTHQEAALNPRRCTNQFSFTKGRCPSQATIIMSELLGESRDLKKNLYACTLDIEKAFDCVPHNHQMRKLWLAGLPASWWELKLDAYNKMTTRVSWKGRLGEEFLNHQGNRQGGKGSAGDFKEYTIEQIETMKERCLGTSIGPVYTGTLAAADDIIMTSHSELEMRVQIATITHLNNKDKLKIHPTKTSVNISQHFSP